MANIGTTIAPWMLFFQQSSVVDKGLKEKDIAWGKFDTLVGAFFTVLVAVFIVIVTGTVLDGQDINDAAQASGMLMETHHYAGVFMAIGLFDAGLLGAICISLASSWAFGEVFGWAHSLNNKISEAPLFLRRYFLRADHRRAGGPDSRRAAGADHIVRPGGGGDAAARGARVPDPAAE